MRGLGIRYWEAQGVKADSWSSSGSKATFRRGERNRRRNLGNILGGKLVEKDQAEAVVWYRRRQTGDVMAMVSLGRELRAARVDRPGGREGVVQEGGRAVPEGGRRRQPAGGRQPGRPVRPYGRGSNRTQEGPRLYRQSADAGDMDGMAGVGLVYAIGRGVPADKKQAAVWYRKVLNRQGREGRILHQLGQGQRGGRRDP